MRVFIIGLFFLGLTSLTYAQLDTDKFLVADGDGNYHVSFVNKSGNIVAIYDTDGRIIETNETTHDADGKSYPNPKTKRTDKTIYDAVGKSYPNLRTKKDIYQLKYNIQKGVNNKPGILIKNSEGNNWIIIYGNETII